MSLPDQIDTELRDAMKAKETLKVSTLRMLKAAMINQAVKVGVNKLEDGDVLKIIQKMVKQHQESIDAFTKAGREDAAQKEREEADFLKGYLPPELSDDELKRIVDSVIQELGVSGPSAMGQVMKGVLSKVEGGADGKKVSQFVNQALGKSS